MAPGGLAAALDASDASNAAFLARRTPSVVGVKDRGGEQTGALDTAERATAENALRGAPDAKNGALSAPVNAAKAEVRAVSNPPAGGTAGSSRAGSAGPSAPKAGGGAAPLPNAPAKRPPPVVIDLDPPSPEPDRGGGDAGEALTVLGAKRPAPAGDADKTVPKKPKLDGPASADAQPGKPDGASAAGPAKPRPVLVVDTSPPAAAPITPRPPIANQRPSSASLGAPPLPALPAQRPSSTGSSPVLILPPTPAHVPNPGTSVAPPAAPTASLAAAASALVEALTPPPARTTPPAQAPPRLTTPPLPPDLAPPPEPQSPVSPATTVLTNPPAPAPGPPTSPLDPPASPFPLKPEPLYFPRADSPPVPPTPTPHSHPAAPHVCGSPRNRGRPPCKLPVSQPGELCAYHRGAGPADGPAPDAADRRLFEEAGWTWDGARPPRSAVEAFDALVNRLRAENAELRGELAESRRRVRAEVAERHMTANGGNGDAEMKGMVESQAAMLRKAARTVESLRGELERERARAERLEGELGEGGGGQEREQLEAELVRARERAERAEADVVAADKRAIQAAAAARAAVEAARKGAEHMKQLEVRCGALDRKLKEAEGNNAVLEDRARQAEAEKEVLAQRALHPGAPPAADAQPSQADGASHRALQADVAQLQHELHSARFDLAKAKKDLKHAESTVDAERKRNAALHSSVVDISAALEESRRELEAATAQKAELDGENSELRAKLMQAIDLWTEESAQYKADKREFDRRLDVAETTAEAAEKKLAEAVAQLVQKEAELSAAATEREKAEKQRDRAVELLQALNRDGTVTRIESLTADLDKANATILDYSGRINDLVKDNGELRTVAERLKGMLQQAREKNAQLNAELTARGQVGGAQTAPVAAQPAAQAAAQAHAAIQRRASETFPAPTQVAPAQLGGQAAGVGKQLTRVDSAPVSFPAPLQSSPNRNHLPNAVRAATASVLPAPQAAPASSSSAAVATQQTAAPSQQSAARVPAAGSASPVQPQQVMPVSHQVAQQPAQAANPVAAQQSPADKPKVETKYVGTVKDVQYFLLPVGNGNSVSLLAVVDGAPPREVKALQPAQASHIMKDPTRLEQLLEFWAGWAGKGP
ncbi:hypothetical protein DFJ74DRAFT_731416 [Hyaloraphidium curvatum]|nr:hypothetical protein DFJ74DRAFT_731416 [Hyaloraphidium curvatum]